MSTDGEEMIFRESAPAATPPATEQPVRVRANGCSLDATLSVPRGAKGVVLVTDGTGRARRGARYGQLARVLNQSGLATLSFDLLTPAEAAGFSDAQRLDLGLLAGRLLAATEWVSRRPDTRGLPVGCFGAESGAAAVLVAAGDWPDFVKAVVVCGARPDLARDALSRVEAATLLLAAGEDVEAQAAARRARRRLRPESKLAIVPGASLQFDAPDALEKVADLAAAWFARHLGGAAARATA
jgi:dienelactone hydrolase